MAKQKLTWFGRRWEKMIVFTEFDGIEAGDSQEYMDKIAEKEDKILAEVEEVYKKHNVRMVIQEPEIIDEQACGHEPTADELNPENTQ